MFINSIRFENEPQIMAAFEVRMAATGEALAEAMKSTCPVDKGELIASIRVMDTSYRKVDVGSDVEHAKFVEFGTVHPANKHTRVTWVNDDGTIRQSVYRAHKSYTIPPNPFMDRSKTIAKSAVQGIWSG